MLTFILGFLGPFIPDIIGMGKAVLDQRHEKEMMKLRLQGENQAAAWRMGEVVAHSDTQAFVTSYQQQESYGVKLLDAGKDATGRLPWYLIPVAWAFSLVDFCNASVRSLLTVAFVGFYLASKYARVELAISALSGGDLTDTVLWATALTTVWDDTDREILILVVGWWFGKVSRSAMNYGKI
jgi:hypothetical protein